MEESEQKRLWIFAVQSYGAMSSFDGGETDIDFDQEPVIVGHQYAKSLADAKKAMAEELAENEVDVEKPEEPSYDDSDTDEVLEAWSEWEEQIDSILNELQFFELALDGQHSTWFAS